MTITEQPVRTNFELVVIDLYRDVHKGIRSELFGVTLDAGRFDPSDRRNRVQLSTRVSAAVDLLVTHAEHEDAAVQPAIELHLPTLAEKIAVDHEVLEGRLVTLRDMAADAVDAVDTYAAIHRMYLELASFTSAYLEHQDIEERVVMPALQAAIGVEGVGPIHGAIIASIPPDEMATALALMLPAMNVDNRAELLGGMKANAPAPVFEGVWGLAGSVLTEADHRAVAARLGIA
jgi:hypothetical protein